MENATKALLITAAVLIVIVLIAIGIYLISSTKDTADSASTMGKVITDSIEDTLYKKIVDIEKFKKSLNRSLLSDYEIKDTADGLQIYGRSIRSPEEAAEGAFHGVRIMKDEFKNKTQYQFKIDFKQIWNDPSWDNATTMYPGLTMKIKYKEESKVDSYNLLKGPDDSWQQTDYKSKEGKTIEYLSLSYGTGNAKTYIKSFDIYEIDSNTGALHGKSIFDDL